MTHIIFKSHRNVALNIKMKTGCWGSCCSSRYPKLNVITFAVWIHPNALLLPVTELKKKKKNVMAQKLCSGQMQHQQTDVKIHNCQIVWVEPNTWGKKKKLCRKQIRGSYLHFALIMSWPLPQHKSPSCKQDHFWSCLASGSVLTWIQCSL